MDLYNPHRSNSSGIRDDYGSVKNEVMRVKEWKPFLDSVDETSKAKAFQSSIDKRPVDGRARGEPPKFERLIPRDDEKVIFTNINPNPKAKDIWLEKNAAKFAIRFRKLRDGRLFVVVGTPAVISEMFKAAKSAGLVLQPKPPRASQAEKNYTEAKPNHWRANANVALQQT